MKKATFILFFLFSTNLFLSAQCVSGDCINGSGVLISQSGDKWIGTFKQGKLSGSGTCYYNNGNTYRGNWENGKRNGYGVLILSNGEKQEGLWRKGKWWRKAKTKPIHTPKTAKMTSGCTSGNCQNGKGTYVYTNGNVYVGEFRQGKIHGTGVCYYADGSKYQGQWIQGHLDGQGTKTYADKTKRTGLWRKGQAIDKQGKTVQDWMLNKSSQNDKIAIQSGCLQGDCENGSGIKAYPDGSKYEGFFRNGKPSGDGVFFYPNGDKYIGAFKNGYRHGIGTLHHVGGSKKSGRWHEGEFWGLESRYTKTKGCIYGDCDNGHGNYVFSDGAKYTGTFRNELPDGRGTIIYPNKERYEGLMSKGFMEGQGTFFMADGTKLSGNWKKGVFLGGSPLPTATHNRPKLKVWALIIGISSYNHMPVLRYPDDDAYRIFAFLQSPSGGAIPEEQIKILIDESATKTNIKNAMKEIFWKAGPNDLVLMYFSGHGLKGAFLPIDYDGSSNKLYHDEIVRILDKSPAKYKLCIADACHSGSLLAARGETEPALTKYYESLANAKAGTALIMSSKSDETSLESSGLRQGVFTHFLIRGMKGEADRDGNKVVNVRELYNFVYTQVREYTRNRQSPIIKGDYDPKMTVGVKW